MSFLATTTSLNYRYNRTKLQHDESAGCGYFVLTVAWLLARGARVEDLESYFTKDLTVNDRKVVELTRREFQLT